MGDIDAPMDTCKIHVFLLLLLLTITAPAVSAPWRSFHYYEKRQAMSACVKFFMAFNSKQFFRLKPLIAPYEINYTGSMWMSAPRFTYLLARARERGAVSISEMEAYSFDDCEKSRRAKQYAQMHYRVFSSESVLVVSKIRKKQTLEPSETVCFVLQNNSRRAGWLITAFSGMELDAGKAGFEPPEGLSSWRAVLIDRIGLELTLPKDFKKQKRDDEIFEYTNKADDAACQIIAFNIRGKLIDESRIWIDKLAKKTGAESLQASYLPSGYRFDINIRRRKIRKKFISAALRGRKFTIIVNFSCSAAYYSAHWKEIDYSLRTVQLY